MNKKRKCKNFLTWRAVLFGGSRTDESVVKWPYNAFRRNGTLLEISQKTKNRTLFLLVGFSALVLAVVSLVEIRNGFQSIFV